MVSGAYPKLLTTYQKQTLKLINFFLENNPLTETMFDLLKLIRFRISLKAHILNESILVSGTVSPILD